MDSPPGIPSSQSYDAFRAILLRVLAGQVRLLWVGVQLCDVYGVANDTAEKAIQ